MPNTKHYVVTTSKDLIDYEHLLSIAMLHACEVTAH